MQTAVQVTCNQSTSLRALISRQEKDTRSLTCRVVNRGRGTPSAIIGKFVEFLLAHHRSRIKHISIFEV
jgi:hypothetical protein